MYGMHLLQLFRSWFKHSGIKVYNQVQPGGLESILYAAHYLPGLLQ